MQLYGGQNPFIYHQPTAAQVEQIETVRRQSEALYRVLLAVVPDCPERTIAIRRLEEVSMWANKSIVFEERV